MRRPPEKYRLKGHAIYGTTDLDGNNGVFVIPHHRIADYYYNCLVSDGMDWEHVSVSLTSKKRKIERCPTWEEMCYVKDIFWYVDEVVIQFHPAKSDYVSMHNYCLHLWKPINQIIPVPNPLLVGVPNS